MTIIFEILNTSITAAASWFTALFQRSGMVSFYLAMVFVFLVGKFILVPLFGSSRGSDSVSKKRSDDNG